MCSVKACSVVLMYKKEVRLSSVNSKTNIFYARIYIFLSVKMVVYDCTTIKDKPIDQYNLDMIIDIIRTFVRNCDDYSNNLSLYINRYWNVVRVSETVCV